MADKASERRARRPRFNGGARPAAEAAHRLWPGADRGRKGYRAPEKRRPPSQRPQSFAAERRDFAERLRRTMVSGSGSYVRGELPSARDTAATFLREAEAEARIAEAGVAHRVLGTDQLVHREFREARDPSSNGRSQCFEPGHDDDLALSLRRYTGVGRWLTSRSRCGRWARSTRASRIDRDGRRGVAAELGHPRDSATVLKCNLELMRGDAPRVERRPRALEARAASMSWRSVARCGVFLEGLGARLDWRDPRRARGTAPRRSSGCADQNVMISTGS